jgi:hypothetical protein
MDEIELLRRYGRRSAPRGPTGIDVTDRVLETIGRGRDERDWLAGTLRPLATAAAASVLVAVTLGVLAQNAVADMQDPLASLFTPFVVTLE